MLLTRYPACGLLGCLSVFKEQSPERCRPLKANIDATFHRLSAKKDADRISLKFVAFVLVARPAKGVKRFLAKPAFFPSFRPVSVVLCPGRRNLLSHAMMSSPSLTVAPEAVSFSSGRSGEVYGKPGGDQAVFQKNFSPPDRQSGANCKPLTDRTLRIRSFVGPSSFSQHPLPGPGRLSENAIVERAAGIPDERQEQGSGAHGRSIGAQPNGPKMQAEKYLAIGPMAAEPAYIGGERQMVISMWWSGSLP